MNIMTRILEHATENACRSLILAMISSLNGRVYNISSGKQVTIIELCKIIEKLMNKNIPLEFIKKDQDKHLVTNRIGSTEKAKNELGFEVDTSLEYGLKQVIDWKPRKSPMIKV